MIPKLRLIQDLLTKYYIILFMLVNPSGKLERLVSELVLNQNYVKAVQIGLRTCCIRQFKLKQIKPNNILQTYYQISSRFYGPESIDNQNSWRQNQLKIFIWLIVGYSYLKNCNILQMKSQDWSFFSEIFKSQTPQTLQYQALLIVKRKFKPQKWTNQEIILLKSIIINNKKKNMWKQTAKTLYLVSQKTFFRTAKQCRQFWINHLDPIPLKTSWSIAEDIELIQATFFYRKKWSKISKHFEGRRTEHMVKNRYNSLYNSELKRYFQHSNIKQYQIMLELKQKLSLSLSQQQQKDHLPLKTIANISQQYQVQLKTIEEIQSKNQSCVSFYQHCLGQSQEEEQHLQQEAYGKAFNKSQQDQQQEEQYQVKYRDESRLDFIQYLKESAEYCILNKDQDDFFGQ